METALGQALTDLPGLQSVASPMQQHCKAPKSLIGNKEFGEGEKEASNEGTGLGERKGAVQQKLN